MPTPRQFAAVVFDMDGLMFNSEEIYWLVGEEVCRRRGCVFTRQVSDEMMGLPPEATFGVMIDRLGLDATWQELLTESEQLYIELLDAHLAPMPGLLDLLDALERAGTRKAIATSSSRKLLDTVLPRFDLQDRFQFALTAEDVTHGKPDPEIYLTAAERFGASPEDTLVLEDSQNGCRAGAAAGAFTVAVPGLHSRNHDFGVASLVVDSLADLRLWEVLGLGVKR
ncbi:MAG: HAD family phosphatase [Planctomycetes bacterium]|nr:HAD family phosphatase [Planctomycetota bacterium]